MEHAAPIGAGRWRWIVLFSLLSLGLVVGGFSYYRFEKRRIRDAKYQELAAIAELKAGQISEWRQRHRADAHRIAMSPLFKKAIAQWLREPETPGLAGDIRERLRLELMDGVYADALLFDLDGRTLLSVLQEPDPLEPAGELAWREAIATRLATVSDLYRFFARHHSHGRSRPGPRSAGRADRRRLH